MSKNKSKIIKEVIVKKIIDKDTIDKNSNINSIDTDNKDNIDTIINNIDLSKMLISPIEEKSNNVELESGFSFSKLSISITKKLSSTVKSNEGIFFTPPTIIHKSIDLIKNIHGLNIINILEPSCGSCEFINVLNNNFSNTHIIGIEHNNTIYNDIKDLKFNNNNNNEITLIKNDYLKWNSDNDELNSYPKFDLIIGNPPYFVIKKENVNKEYYKYFDGRPNIYIIFIIHSLLMLNDNGILLFVLPSNFINCLYYNELRKYIYENYKILDIIDCKDDEYLETEQDTIIFMIQKNNDDMKIINKKFILEINNYIIFNTEKNIKRLNELYKDSITLSKLKFDVNVGTIVWNQVKNILTDNPKYTRLIYSSDIKDKTLIIKEYSNKDKKNYIDKKGVKEPILVLNRGYGKGKYKLDYCLIDIDYEYLIENHLICIKYNENIDKTRLIDLYNNIIMSFDDERTSEFINLYFGNSAINTTELKYILPIYIKN
jgi:tRNA1(Val) A37 N6-methylase TrmN6